MCHLRLPAVESMISERQSAKAVIMVRINTSIIQYNVWPEVLQQPRKHLSYLPVGPENGDSNKESHGRIARCWVCVCRLMDA